MVLVVEENDDNVSILLILYIAVKGNVIVAISNQTANKESVTQPGSHWVGLIAIGLSTLEFILLTGGTVLDTISCHWSWVYRGRRVGGRNFKIV